MTIEDIKTLESLFIVEMHSAERIFRLIETGMETIYRESKDYKALWGPRSEPSRKAVRSGESGGTSRPHQLAERFGLCDLVADATLKVCKTLHHYMDRLTIAGIEMNPGTKDKGRKEAEMFDALQSDSNQLAYVHALLSNVPESDMLRVISTLKVLAKDHSVSPAILEELKTN